ncbi:MAG: GerAB/ArcD/ProY family transporter, partial [Syntrophomonadaceae bacterium]|nr:GerAB/ArcD/ProY family transporter [Syntrophomonadaceae bacterium]
MMRNKVMQLERSKISSAELIALATAFYLGTSFVTTPGTGAENNAWLAVLLGFLEGLLFLLVLFAIIKKYPDKTLIQINDIVFGPLLGKLISILYLLFFLNVATLVMRIFAEYFAISMTQTPLAVFLAGFILVPALAVRNGIEVIGRTSLIIFPLIIFAAILDTLLLIPEMNLSNLFPFMDIPLKNLALAAQETNSLTVGESLVFLMILVSLNKPPEAKNSILKAVLLAGIILLIITIRNILVLGELLTIVIYPSFSAIRLI